METFVTPQLWLNITRIGIVCLTLLLGIATYQSNLLLKRFQPDFNLLLSPPELIVRILLVGLCLFLAWLSGLPARQLGLTVANLWQSISLGLGIGLATQLSIYSITWWAIKRFGRQIYSPLVVRNILPHRPVEWLWVSVALVPAVAMEELLFRTLWLGCFDQIMARPVLIGLTSIVFGLMHLPQGILGVILTGSINVFFCLLFIWSGELLVPLIAHYVVNLLQLIVASHQRNWLEDYEQFSVVDKSQGT